MPPNPDQCIELSCKATDLFTAYADKIEYQMSENETLADYREFFSKLPGKTLRMAGLLHLCEHSPSECISGETMAAAIEISKYYGQHYLTRIRTNERRNANGSLRKIYSSRSRAYVFTLRQDTFKQYKQH